MDKYDIGFTHLYNAMSGNNHREPGVLSAALEKAILLKLFVIIFM